MDTSPGTDPLEGGASDWVFVDFEAEDVDGGETDEEEDEGSGEDMVDFIDDTEGTQNTQDYYRCLQMQQQKVDDERAVTALKRKFFESPKTKVDSDISPRLAAITLEGETRTGRARRKLYTQTVDDSGNGDSLEETSGKTVVGANVKVLTSPLFESTRVGERCLPVLVENGSQEQAGSEDDTGSVMQLLKAGKPRVLLFGLFKEIYGCSFADLTRCFKSDRTVCEDWICLIAGVPCSLVDAITELLKPHASYTHVTCTPCKVGMLLLLLVQWKTNKNRETVANLLGGLLQVQKQQMLLEPPRIRCPAAAMFWYKKSMCNGTVVSGEMPQWILKQVSIQEQLGNIPPFQLSLMIQWAYDNGYDTESRIAYEYAALANEDKNAEAFLRSNSQAKFVKDCACMVRHYKKAEMDKMSIGQWIKHRCEKIAGDGDWRPIMKFLKYHSVEIMPFLMFFRRFLKGIPKSNCLVLYGPANSGKSYFAMSLINMLGGKVISHVNAKSHFWLQPLADGKIALLDDATPSTWDYMDTFLRNLLDGNTISLDTKHKAPLQIRSPPLIVTTNYNVLENEKWKYLHSRIKQISFLNPCPLDCRGDPEIKLNNQNWKAFFEKCWARLSLDDLLEEGDGETMQPLRCAARGTDGTD
ncbi:E1 [Tursiops truncatus papillomavirus 1]|uniref:Replication protein E1 n=1 Tax=Tursiops truncatus papillomavirus 1 TaxID=936059 RepID=B4XYE1_9PAPI|nr:E1 [Tursiops truncatus papillomavirus 1]ABY73445.1 E1 [Tursiops truncatus papillomavirus 1]